MNKEEKQAIEIVKEITFVRGIRKDVDGEEEDLCALEEVLNYIDKLQKEIDNLIKENHKHIDYIADMKKKHEDKKKADMNKLINYIAVRENKTHEEVCKEFEV